MLNHVFGMTKHWGTYSRTKPAAGTGTLLVLTHTVAKVARGIDHPPNILGQLSGMYTKDRSQ